MIMLSMVLTPLSAIAQGNEETDEELSNQVTESAINSESEDSEIMIEKEMDETSIEEEEKGKTIVSQEVKKSLKTKSVEPKEIVEETVSKEEPTIEKEVEAPEEVVEETVSEEVESTTETEVTVSEEVEQTPEAEVEVETTVSEEVEEEPTAEPEVEEAEEIVEEEKETSVQTMSIMPMAVIGTPGNYTIDPNTIVVPAAIKGKSSQNKHTRTKLIWASGSTVYVLINSTHPLQSMTLNGVVTTNMDEYGAMVAVTVAGTTYNDPTIDLQGNLGDAHWTVFKFNVADLNLDDREEYTFAIQGINTGSGGHSIDGTLAFTIPKIDVVGKKAWVGGTERPSITLQLFRSAANQTPSKVRDSESAVNGSETPAWTYKWSDVPKYDNVGRPYTYTVDELTVPANYVKTLNGLTVTNTYSPSTINIDVNKVWIGPAADSVTFKLFADGVDTGETLVLPDEENNWAGSFKNLNQLDDVTGEEIIYTVEEVEITGYSTVKTGSVSDGFTFTNRNDEMVSIDVEKKWVGKVGNPVDVNLLANGVETGQSVNLKESEDEDNDWKSTFPNPVRKYDATTGKLINYSVVEPEVPYGYEVSYGKGENGQLIVTNTAIIGSIKVEKVDENGDPLNGAIFELQDQNGNVIATGTSGTPETPETPETPIDGEILFSDLKLGDYFLVEIKAPAGYRILVSKIPVTVSNDKLDVVKKVENTRIGWEIPATGGVGTSLFYGIGALLMASTLILFLRRRKTKA